MKLRTYKAVCPKIYGQPKAHKAGLPLRPVVPCMTAPSYELSKFVGSILRKSLTSKYNIKDSFEFCQYVNNICLPTGHILVSFDVVSLFTSIPKELVRHSIFRRWNDIENHTPICLDLFWEITEFCIDCSYFSFEGAYYIQKFGTAMGNPLSPIIADLVMEDILDEAISKTSCVIPFIKKYVDDLFLVLPPDKVQDVVNTFNEVNQNIQFTLEMEEGRRLPFLDMALIRQEDDTVKTEWYCKSIASGRFLNFHSSHPMHQKMNVAQNFVKRVMVFSTNLDLKRKREIVHRHLKANDYPKCLINRLINRAKHQTVNNNTAMDVSRTETETETHQDEMKFYSLTNIDGLTQQITKTLKRDYPGIKIANRQHKTIGSLLPSVKDKTPNTEQSNVVYKIDCADCEACYIGMTSTKLKQRISGHRSNLKKLKTLLDKGYTNEDAEVSWVREKTALVNHAATMDHNFKLDETNIIDRTFKTNNLHILESCHIYNTNNTVNKRTDTDNLHVAYAGLLHLLKNETTNRR